METNRINTFGINNTSFAANLKVTRAADSVLSKIAEQKTDTANSALLDMLKAIKRSQAKNFKVHMIGDRVIISTDGKLFYRAKQTKKPLSDIFEEITAKINGPNKNNESALDTYQKMANIIS